MPQRESLTSACLFQQSLKHAASAYAAGFDSHALGGLTVDSVSVSAVPALKHAASAFAAGFDRYTLDGLL